MSQSDFLINNLICPTLLGTSKGQLGGSCWRSLTTISRRQLDQKIMRVCISYMHPYPIKFLNHTLPFRICKLCFQANMQVTSTFWPDIKSQILSEHRFNQGTWRLPIGPLCWLWWLHPVAPCSKYKGVEIRTRTHKPHTSHLSFLAFLA